MTGGCEVRGKAVEATGPRRATAWNEEKKEKEKEKEKREPTSLKSRERRVTHKAGTIATSKKL